MLEVVIINKDDNKIVDVFNGEFVFAMATNEIKKDKYDIRNDFVGSIKPLGAAQNLGVSVGKALSEISRQTSTPKIVLVGIMLAGFFNELDVEEVPGTQET